jgi:hypothetical protein
MAAPLDQTATVLPLNDITEQHLDDVIQESSQSRQIDLTSSEGGPSGAPQLPPLGFWSITAVVVWLVLAFIVALSHHFFLHYLHGRNIDEYPGQAWMKGFNNGFSNIFSIVVGWSVSSALTQIVRSFSYSNV